MIIRLTAFITLAASCIHVCGGENELESLDYVVNIRPQQLRSLSFGGWSDILTAAAHSANDSLSGASAAAPAMSFHDLAKGLKLQDIPEKQMTGELRVSLEDPSGDSPGRGVQVELQSGDWLVGVGGLPVMDWSTVKGAAQTFLSQQQQHDGGGGGGSSMPPFRVALPVLDEASGSRRLLGFVSVETLPVDGITFRPAPATPREQELRRRVEAREEARRQEQARQEEEARHAAEAAQASAGAAEDERKRRVDQVERARLEEEDRATKRQRGLGFTYTVAFHDSKAPIGLTFDMTAGQETRVMAVQPDSPAAKAKVQAGDLLIEVNEKPLTKMGPSQAIQVLSRTPWPRYLTFRVPATREDDAQRDALWATLVVTSPEVAAGTYAAMLAPWANTTLPPTPAPPPPHTGATSADQCLSTEGNVSTSTSSGGNSGNASSQPVWQTASGQQSILTAPDILGCQRMHNVHGIGGALVLARRGECTFVDKTRRVQEAGGAGVLVVNTVDQIGDMPAGLQRTDDLRVPVAMLRSADGDLLSSVMEVNGGSLRGYLLAGNHTIESLQSPPVVNGTDDAKPVPAAEPLPKKDQRPPSRKQQAARQRQEQHQRMKASSAQRGPVMRGEYDTGGRMLVHASGGVVQSYDFRSAMFGPRAKDLRGRLVIPDPSAGCDARTFKSRVKGTIVAVERGGGCAFSDKALAAQKAGAIACVVMNTQAGSGVGGLMRLMAAPEEADKVAIPVYMVTDRARDDLMRLASRGKDMMVRIQEEDLLHNHDPPPQ